MEERKANRTSIIPRKGRLHLKTVFNLAKLLNKSKVDPALPTKKDV